MNVVAWTGVGIAAVVLVFGFFISGITGLLTTSVGRALLGAWVLLGTVTWGLVGAVYLIVMEAVR